MAERLIEDKAVQGGETRSLGTTIAAAIAGGAAGGAAGSLVSNALNRPPKEEPPKVILPPGVSKES